MATPSIPDAPIAQQEAMLPLGNASTPYRSIVVSDVEAGEDDVIATCTVKIGGVVVRRVSLRRGRGNTTYVNYPSFQNDAGKFVRYFEVISPSLEAAIREERPSTIPYR